MYLPTIVVVHAVKYPYPTEAVPSLSPSRSLRLQCQHFFHAGCLRQYLNNSAGSTTALCPICRAAIPWYPAPLVTPKQNLDGTGAVPRRPTNNNALPRGNNNVPTPDSLSRAARGAHLVARIARRSAQTWRGLVDADGSAAAAAAAAAAATAATAATPPTPAGATAVGGYQRPLLGSGTPARPGAAARGGDGSRREARVPADEAAPWRRGGVEARVTWPGPESSEVEAVALQLVDIFPDMGRQVALARARAARGSVERAVELTLAVASRG